MEKLIGNPNIQFRFSDYSSFCYFYVDNKTTKETVSYKSSNKKECREFFEIAARHMATAVEKKS